MENGKVLTATCFNSVADLYDRIRPGYPQLVLEKIEQYAALQPQAKIVEVGPGTGQASGYFINRGYTFLGVELGADLTACAQRKYGGRPNAEFVNISFEDWNGSGAPYDLFLAAQSFHWIATNYGIGRAAEVLKPEGTIALLWNLDESQSTEFWRRSTPLHDQYFPGGSGKSGADLFKCSQIYTAALQGSHFFGSATILEHKWERAYSADEWVAMRNTFSPDLRLEPARRKEFHDKLRLIIEELGGSFTRYYRCYCVLARRG